MRLCLCAAHAPFKPHLSGYESKLDIPDEHPTSVSISKNAIKKLDKNGFSRRKANGVYFLDFDNRFDCRGECCGKSCQDYNRGLVELTKRSALYDFAVQFHIDSGSEHKRGPLALTSGSNLANAWAEDFLNILDALSGISRRGKLKLGGKYRNGVFDMRDKVCEDIFGSKYFLRRGAENAVIIEVGVSQNKLDMDWLKGNGISQCGSAAAIATKNTL